jgi:uncharacterized protein (DUF1778 family)
MADNDKTPTLTQAERTEFLAQLDNPDSPVSRAVAARAEFIRATETPEFSRAARARFADPEEREASWQTIGVRVPVDQKRQIEAAAAAAGRTVAKEIRWRLALAAYALALVEEIERQHETLAAALDKEWSQEELKKLFRVHMDKLELMSFRYRPSRQARFVAGDR